MQLKRILIVEDTLTELTRYATLAESMMHVVTATTLHEAKRALDTQAIDVLLTDVHLTKSIQQDSYEGYEIIKYAGKNHPEILIMAMSSDPKIETYQAIYALGARHFIKKPIVSLDELKIALQTATHNQLFAKYTKNKSKECALPSDLAQKCKEGLVLDEDLRRRAIGLANRKDIATVIYGESGTGKEEIAKMIHKYRVESESHVPFVAVNCANLDSSTAASRLFGHKKGSFTGADSTTIGFVGEANGGILFLDEIHCLSQECQARLLRVMNDGTYERFGDTKTLHSSFQVIVASTKNLDLLVEEGQFMIDLRSRLTGIDLNLKPLRQRTDDMDLLVRLFFAKEQVQVSDEEIRRIVERCKSYYWQGNIRQLHNVLKSMVVACEMDAVAISSDKIPEFLTMFAPNTKGNQNIVDEFLEKGFEQDRPLKESLEYYEKLIIKYALQRHRKIGDVAKALEISRTALDVKRRRYDLLES